MGNESRSGRVFGFSQRWKYRKYGKSRVPYKRRRSRAGCRRGGGRSLRGNRAPSRGGGTRAWTKRIRRRRGVSPAAREATEGGAARLGARRRTGREKKRRCFGGMWGELRLRFKLWVAVRISTPLSRFETKRFLLPRARAAYVWPAPFLLPPRMLPRRNGKMGKTARARVPFFDGAGQTELYCRGGL
jgi:hypothetical protein